MNRSFLGDVCRERSSVNQRSRRRRLRLEQFENRLLMAADSSIENLSPLIPDSQTSSVWVPTDLQDNQAGERSDPYYPDSRIPDVIEEDTSWILRLDAESLTELFALSTPAILGEFTPQSLAFTTLANGMPILNSLLGAPTSVYLDFDGDTTTATDPYDTDSIPTAFNVTEQKQIAEAWRHLSTYFAMFDTNVTTIQPPTAQPKVWASIGNNISGGYCYVNTFPNTIPRCFNQSGDARTRQSGIAHEVGHNFGLQHQSDFDLFGTETADYSSGKDELHVPIMGVDFAQRVRKFVIGHTTNASALQDDVNVITSKIIPYQPVGGDGFRADDVGGTITSAAALTALNDVQYATGIIERLSDVDAYSFNSNGQTITVSALADFPSGVDLKLEIYDALGVLVAAKDSPSLNDQEITLVLPTGTYYAMVSSHGNYGDLGTYNLAVRSLPTGWKSGDIGVVGITGFSQFHSSTNSYVLGASGADIGGTSDEMQFARQTLTGDGTIIARVTSLINTTGNAKAGIEIRETTAVGSKHVSLTATPTGGVKFIRRTSTGGSSTTTSGTTAAFTPVWLRLQRVGNVITASTSADGNAWTTLGTPATVAMNSAVQIGLVATAQNDRLYTAAEFENVSITGNLGDQLPNPNALPAPTGLAVTRATGTDLSLNWDNQANQTGYRIERSIDGATFTTAGTTAADVTTFVDTGLVGTMRYFYRVLALDASGASIPSTIVSELNRPSAVGNLQLTSYSTTQIVLDWIETSGETGYRIERSTDGLVYTNIATVGVNFPSYTAGGLAAGTSYFFRVTPTSAFGDGPSTVLSGGTRMAQVTNLAFTSVTGNSIALSWTDLTTETGYQVQRSTNGTTFSTLATVAAGSVAYTDNTVTPGNEYYYRVLGTVGQSVSVYNLAFTATPTVTALPTPWTAVDIGTASGGTGSSRSTTFNSTDSSFKVVSSGTSIGGTADSFRFTHQTLTGDGVVTARVSSLEDSAAGNTRFGVMFRENLNTGSRYASMLLRKDNSPAQFSARTSAGISATTANDAVRNTPYWVRVSRSGNVFTGFTSSDGNTWTQIGQSTIAMPATVYVGLAGSAGTTASLNTATATNVSIIANPVLAVTSGNRIYNDSAYVATASMSNNTLPAPTISFVYSSDPAGTAIIPAPVNVGTYYVRAVSAANAGNNAAQSSISSFQITPFGLTVSVASQPKVYDGTTAANAVFSDNRFVGDVFAVSGTAAFSSKDVGVAKSVSVLNVSISGVDASNYTFNTSTTTNADITPKTLVATSTSVNKVYDGNPNADVTISLAGIITGETVVGAASAFFSDKNAGIGKTVTTGTVALSGTDSGNYSVGPAAVTTANITPLQIEAELTVFNRVYDGTVNATIDSRTLIGVLSGDSVNFIGGTAQFGDKNVGSEKPVSATGLTLDGLDAANYVVAYETVASANITRKLITPAGEVASKVYDATTDAVVTISLDAVVAGDELTGIATATFADKNVGTEKLVTIGIVSLAGADSDNYIVDLAPDATAAITAKPIVGLITVVDKVFDGTTAATILTRTLAGVYGTDVVDYVGGTANFDTPAIGYDKVVTAIDLELAGADAGNYIVNSSASTTANITQPVASIAARKIFYNNASGTNLSSAGPATGAIAVDKAALLPGQASTFQNYTSYLHGVNGVIVDIADLPQSTTDVSVLGGLRFARWNGIATEGFVDLPLAAIPTATILRGLGDASSDRVKITFPDGSLKNTWLRVIVAADAQTGLAADDVFYFGNVVGEVNIGNTPTRLRVNGVDSSAVLANQSAGANTAPVTNLYDINRDGRVNGQDRSIVLANQQPGGIVAPITAPLPPPPPSGAMALGYAVANTASAPTSSLAGSSSSRLSDFSQSMAAAWSTHQALMSFSSPSQTEEMRRGQVRYTSPAMIQESRPERSVDLRATDLVFATMGKNP
jgi:regulation of enolase protein 1 (concanavalin A-like superfamily)